MSTSTPTSAPGDLNLKNIQGDILSGFPKKRETFYFFEILDAIKFREDIRKLIPDIKNVSQVLEAREEICGHKKMHPDGPLCPFIGVNIGFSHFGFQKLGIDDSKLIDPAFLAGQRADAENLGDKGTKSKEGKFIPDWEEEFKQDIHGVMNIASNCPNRIREQVRLIEGYFKVGTAEATMRKVTSICGNTRPKEHNGEEHFGFLDGISNPAVIGFDVDPPPGPAPVRAGVIIVGHDGDPNKAGREPWMTDGSFMAFRLLYQRVPEFDEFVWANRLKLPGLSDQQGADLFGARLMGRWKSGAPLDLAPFFDDPALGKNENMRNNYRFAAEKNFQKFCPFAAHARKMLPRADLEDHGIPIERRRIMRRGIQFGEEVTPQERENKKTEHGRGLLFVCYQSSIMNGFQFVQTGWANEAKFPKDVPQLPGLDPIIGQNHGKDDRGPMSGTNPDKPSEMVELTEEWVVPRGGEYFFTPSINALKETIAL